MIMEPDQAKISYANWLAKASIKLSENCAQDPYLDPRFDAKLLLQYVTKKNTAQLFAFPETLLNARQLAELECLLARRLAQEPMAYILGEQDFLVA